MTNILDTVDQRTNLVGQNRLELLTFRLRGSQMFGINVFKVQEVQSLPRLNSLPKSDPVVVGVTNIRNQTIPVIDLSLAIGRRAIDQDESANIIVTEYNGSVQAFLVGAVDRIVNLNWDSISPPPPGSGRQHFLTAITRIDEKIVEIIDVERVLANIIHFDVQVSSSVLDAPLHQAVGEREVLLVDDSQVAIDQARSTLRQLGVKVHIAHNGRQALDLLRAWADAGENVGDKLLMLITDAEMPEMDGYRLTAEVRADARLRSLYIVLHTSLSGSFNQAMVEKVGCDGFLSKFKPDGLATVVQARMRQLLPAVD